MVDKTDLVSTIRDYREDNPGTCFSFCAFKRVSTRMFQETYAEMESEIEKISNIASSPCFL
jgi:hypothetical protein